MFFKIQIKFTFSFLIIFSIILDSRCLESTKKDTDYPLKYRLNNGNYILIITTGIYLYDPTFTEKAEIKSFGSRVLDINEDAYPTEISQFLSEDGGYIICIVKNKLYAISKNGLYLTELEIDYIKLYDKCSYPIIPYGHSENDYFFVIITKEGNNIIFRKYKYNSNNNKISFINDYIYNSNDGEKNNISCQLMYYSNQKVIFCFYGSFSKSFGSVFNIDDFNIIEGMFVEKDQAGGQIFKTNLNPKERSKTVCCVQHDKDLKCFIYDINTNNFGDIFTVTEYGCDCEQIDMMVEYFPEREEFVCWCVDHYDMYLGRFSKNFEFTKFEKIQNLVNPDECEEPKRFNLFYSSTYEKYVVLTDTNCKTLYPINSIEAAKMNDYPTDETILICEKYYDYELTSCFETVPNGYYHNDTTSKIIYKCHENCETCIKGPTTDNNNCLICKNSKFFDLNNCVDICPNGGYLDNIDNINKCKCSFNIKCEYCSLESKSYNLCISCNKNKGYYPILNDNNNIDSFINCYNTQTIYGGYYLNSNTGYYEKCYSTCNKCNEVGDVNNNKCTECISTHEFKSDFENDYNCYPKCDKYYYFDSSKNYYCVNECPSEYSKLIEPKNKCIFKCNDDQIYKYEYQNKCYENCSSKYYNFDKTSCIDNIPDGYYCNDESLKTIDKCHDNCATCNEGPITDNNNCLTCKNSKFLDLGNCVNSCINDYYLDIDGINKCKCSKNIKCEKCSNQSNQYNLCISCNKDKGYYPILNDNNTIDSFINCYNNQTIYGGYYLNSNTGYYEKCYSTCNKCNEVGDVNNNKCTECISTHEFKSDFENDYNCYPKCDKYYYFDSSKNYYCVNECPSEYSKLLGKRCVDNCSNYNDYKYEYDNKCYNKCPSLAHNSKENEYLCIDDIICKPKYYSYDLTKCIDKVPDGYYCNDTDLKTIDRCHDNCATCNQGPISDNNNCLTCKSSKFLDLGNCVDECINGFFIDTDNISKCKCSNDVKCLYCTKNSLNKGLCISCNNDEGYYQKSDNEIIKNNSFVNCYKDLEGYYLDYFHKNYKPCYSTCKNCYGQGDEFNNNCSECKPEFEFKKDFENDNNCYQKCNDYYYFDTSKKYHCTKGKSCPSNYKLIISKNKCVDACSKDDIYKFEYKNICYEKCPTNTTSSNDNFFCEEIKNEETIEQCKISKNKLLSSQKGFSINDLNPLTKKYSNYDSSKNDFILTYENDIISVYIYKNISCLEIAIGSAPQINFGECYQKLKNYYNISQDLIISIININYNINYKPITTYAFSNPITGEILSSKKICEKEKIVIKEDVKTLIDNIDNENKEEFIIFCAKQGIDVFNISDKFYNDLCYHFESPNRRDIPLKDRIAMVYPNITLCDQGCENKGVDLETLKAKCVCTFNDLMNSKLFTDNLYGQYIEEIMSIVSSLNIAVVKCIKDIFILKYFIKNDGGFIFIGLFLCEVFCILKFLPYGLFDIRKFLFSLFHSYANFIKKYHNDNINRNKNNFLNINGSFSSSQNQTGTSSKTNLKSSSLALKKKIKQIPIISKCNNKDGDIKNDFKQKIMANKHKKDNLKSKINEFETISNKKNKKIKKKEKELVNIQEYLSLSFDENDFDDVIEKDKRNFFQYFCEKFQENQIFINTFAVKETFRPIALKALVLLVTICLYFLVNALFYTEEYLSKILYIEENDSFLAFVPRRFNHFIYIYAVVGIMTYAIGFFFIEERKIKKMFLRNKEVDIKLKYDISIVMKQIKSRFISLIIISLIITIISFFYISCFNLVYPNSKREWLISSIFIIIMTQIINIIVIFIEGSIRFIAIKCNSEKFFKLSLIFN